MHGKKIVIIGGSIAGCASGILLSRFGADVTILERSSGCFGLGSGVMLPKKTVDRCIENDLFDSNIGRSHVSNRYFYRKNEQNQEHFWTQPIRAIAFNWAEIYQNLRRRVAPAHYHTHAEVTHLEKNEHGYRITTTNGKIYEADLVIAADGVDSIARANLLPEAQPEYTGYIAWRGVIENQSGFEKDMSYYAFPNGHLLLYRIPASDYTHTKKTLLNWVMFENHQELSLMDLLIDNQGKQHTRSLPAGYLTEQHIHYLHQLSQSLLPAPILDVIVRTPQPFIQAIFDFQIPTHLNEHVIFVGDAASTLRPHSGSGVSKAIGDGFQFSDCIKSDPKKKLTEIVTMWNTKQALLLSEEVQKSKRLGKALVTHTPDWMQMNQDTMDQWWIEKTWYTTL